MRLIAYRTLQRVVFLAALSFLLLFISLPGLSPVYPYDQPHTLGSRGAFYFFKNDSSNTTVTVVPANDTKITRLFGLTASVATADAISVYCGSQQKTGLFLAANSGLSQVYFPFAISCRGISPNLSGTADVSSANPAVITGHSSTFTTDFGVGDRFVDSAGNTLTIATVTNNTSMTATAAATTPGTGYTYQRGADNLNLVKGTNTTNLNASGWYEQE